MAWASGGEVREVVELEGRLGFPLLLRPVVRYVCAVFASAYLSEYLALSGLPRAEVDVWRTPVAAARLSEDVPWEREWLLDIVRAGVTSSAA